MIRGLRVLLSFGCGERQGRLFLPMATNAPWSIGGSIKSLILRFDIQKCEFCAQI